LHKPAKKIHVTIDGQPSSKSEVHKLEGAAMANQPLDSAMSEAVSAISISDDGKLTIPQKDADIKPVPGVEAVEPEPVTPEIDHPAPDQTPIPEPEVTTPESMVTPAELPKFGALQPKIDEHPLFSGTKEPAVKEPRKKGMLKRTLMPLLCLFIVAAILYLLIDAGVVRGASHLPFHIFKQPVAATSSAITQPQATAQSAATPTALDPYAGWKSYTLQYEKLSFLYPNSWKFSNSTSADGDDISLTSPGGLTVFIITGAHPPVDHSANDEISSEAIKFVGKPALLSLWASEQNNDKTQAASAILTDTNGKQFNALNSPKDTQAGNSLIDIEIGFGQSTGDNNPKTVSVSSLSSSSDYTDAKLIIQSMTY